MSKWEEKLPVCTSCKIKSRYKGKGKLCKLKAGLKLSIQKTKIMASCPIISWQMDEEKMEIVGNFMFMGSKFTADGECIHEFKRCLHVGRKTLTNLDSILKNRDIILPTKVHMVKLWFVHSAQFSSVTQSCPTLQPHGLQHTSPPCPSPTPGVYPNPCPSSW